MNDPKSLQRSGPSTLDQGEQAGGAQRSSDMVRTAIWDLVRALEKDLQSVLVAGAVPHGFNVEILSALLPSQADDMGRLYIEMQSITLVQPYPGSMHCLHDLAREAILNRLWLEERDRYRELSARAAEYFVTQQTVEAQIEVIYHRLVADEAQGLEDARQVRSRWLSRSQHALAATLLKTMFEHIGAGRLEADTAQWASLWQAEALHALSDYQGAICELHGVIDSAPSARLEARARTLLGKALLATEGPERALPEIKTALSLYQGLDKITEQADANVVLGDIYWEASKLDEARDAYTQAVVQYEQDDDRLGQMQTVYRLGRMHWAQGNLPEAEECFARALSYFEGQQYDLATADITMELGNLARARDDYDTAKSYYDQALERYDHDMSKAGQAVALVSIADIERKQGRQGEAGAHYDAALHLARLIGLGYWTARALRGLGDLMQDGGDYEAAMETYSQALDISKEVAATRLEAEIRAEYGRLYLWTGKFDLAREQYLALLTHYERLQAGPKDIGQARYGLGNCLQEMGNFSEAREQHTLALQLFQRAQSPRRVADVTLRLGDLELAEGHPQEARGQYLNALAAYREIGDRHGAAAAVRGLGDLSLRQGGAAEARRLWEQALDQFRQLGAMPDANLTLERLAQLDASGSR